MIPASELFKQAHRLGVGDRVIEKDYVLSWLLIAIAESKLRDKLAFKGGTALKKCYYPDYRFSEDLDFTLCSDLSHDALIKAFESLFPRLSGRVNLTLTLRSAEQSVFNSSTLLINYVGPLKASLGSRHLKIDVTRGELLLYPLAERLVHASYSDFPLDVTLPTYSLEEVLIEKLCALMGRTEPRDLYDIYQLFQWGDVDLSFLPHNFAVKCQHKGQNPARLAELDDKAGTFEKLWASRLAVQVAELPHLDEILRVVKRYLRSLDMI